MRMRNLCDAELEQLERHLAKATRERLFQWQWLNHHCVHALINDFGIFLEKEKEGVVLRVYCLNVIVLETERESLPQLFNLALAQVRWRSQLSADEIAGFNLQAPKLTRARKDLTDIMDKIFDQPL